SNAAYSSVFPEGNAGEFQIAALTGYSGVLQLQELALRAGGSYFQTFCAQFAEDVFSGVNYTWTLDTNLNSNPATPLLGSTAYLCQRFFDGSLASAGYSYTLGAPRSESAKALQLAMWKLQGQIPGGSTFETYFNTNPQAIAYYNLGLAHAADPIGNVRVLV